MRPSRPPIWARPDAAPSSSRREASIGSRGAPLAGFGAAPRAGFGAAAPTSSHARMAQGAPQAPSCAAPSFLQAASSSSHRFFKPPLLPHTTSLRTDCRSEARFVCRCPRHRPARLLRTHAASAAPESSSSAAQRAVWPGSPVIGRSIAPTTGAKSTLTVTGPSGCT